MLISGFVSSFKMLFIFVKLGCSIIELVSVDSFVIGKLPRTILRQCFTIALISDFLLYL